MREKEAQTAIANRFIELQRIIEKLSTRLQYAEKKIKNLEKLVGKETKNGKENNK